MEWEVFWNDFLEEYHLRKLVDDMNQVDYQMGNESNIEKICRGIYNDYNIWKGQWKKLEQEIWKVLEELSGVHLHTGRVKSLKSLLEKVITRRYKLLSSKSSKYAKINEFNYKEIITDLIGLRLIISYRGDWEELHDEILQKFPYDDNQKYEKDVLVPHPEEGAIQAELPKVYYAEGDNIQKYKERGLATERRETNYRGIHYIISYHKMYVEIQVRTIYDEAWSDCDHRYVYKHENNNSHTALRRMSMVLSKLTNISNDINSQMRDIYQEQSIWENTDDSGAMDSQWYASQESIDEIEQIIMNLEQTESILKDFRKRIVVKIDENGG